MKAPTPFWSLAVVSILAFELNPSACSFSSERPVGGGGGNNGTPATGGQTGSAGNPGLAGTSGGQGGGSGGSNLGVDAGGKVIVGNTQCSDGIDNDGDGKIDYADPECVGPLDNDESSFATGIPGDNIDACKQDCFFDGNSGMGDDDCQWQLKCDPMSAERELPLRRRRTPRSTPTECSVVGVAVADLHRRLPQAGAERLRLLRLLRRFRARRRRSAWPRPARPPTSTTRSSARPARRSPSARTPATTARSASASRRCRADCGPVVADGGGTPPPPPACPGTHRPAARAASIPRRAPPAPAASPAAV